MALNLLIVDDDRIDREAIKRYISRSRSDAVFFEAETGKEAIDYMQKRTFDCVFLDYNLPDIDGIGLLKDFYNEDTGLPPSPVVMLTGQGSELVMIDAIRCGAQDYLVKDHMSADTLQIAMSKAREFFDLKISQKQAEELLVQSQKMEAVGQLTSGIAHDFNNLLTVILGNTRIMRKKMEMNDNENLSKDDFYKKVESIEASARKGADLVKRLMVFTRQQPLAAEVININERIKDVRTLLQSTLGSIIEIKTVLAEDIWPLEIDIGQFENALINMAVNARDAMPKGGALTIKTCNITIDGPNIADHLPDQIPAGRYVRLTVSDTGEGMPQHVAQRIFEPFYTTKGPGEGTGLGLSMVYGMVRQSGGHISVDSKPGHGAIFSIYWPAKTEDQDDKKG